MREYEQPPLDAAIDDALKDYIASLQQRQEKVEAAVKLGKSLEETKAEFDSGEARLVEVIYNEIKDALAKSAIR